MDEHSKDNVETFGDNYSKTDLACDDEMVCVSDNVDGIITDKGNSLLDNDLGTEPEFPSIDNDKETNNKDKVSQPMKDEDVDGNNIDTGNSLLDGDDVDADGNNTDFKNEHELPSNDNDEDTNNKVKVSRPMNDENVDRNNTDIDNSLLYNDDKNNIELENTPMVGTLMVGNFKKKVNSFIGNVHCRRRRNE